MVTIRVLLLLLILLLIGNRVITSLRSAPDNREYVSEFRYSLIMVWAVCALVILGIFIVSPSILDFAQITQSPPLYITGCMALLMGMVLWIWSRVSLSDNWSPRIAIRDDHTLVTKGPYRVIRHPVYSSYILQVIGIALATANWMVILPCAAITTLTWRRANTEEDVLIQKFGEQYIKYQKRTGMFFPRLSK